MSRSNIFDEPDGKLKPNKIMIEGAEHILSFYKGQVKQEDEEFFEYITKRKGTPTFQDLKRIRSLLLKYSKFFNAEENNDILNAKFQRDDEEDADKDAIENITNRFKEFFLDQYENPMALSLNNEVLPINEKKFETVLAKFYHEETGEILHSWDKNDIIGLFTMKAHEGNVYDLSVRASGDSKEVYLDLGNRKFNAVRLTTGKIELLVPDRPIFRRYRGDMPISIDFSGNREDLEKFFGAWKFDGEKDLMLYSVSAATPLLPNTPNVIKTVSGDNGAGKSNLTKYEKKIFDPNVIESTSVKVGKEDDFKQTLSHNLIVNVDNLTIPLSSELADIACRASTGDSISKRALYTNDEDFFIKFRRTILFNGINKPSDRGDFAERDLHFKLIRPEREKRETEEQLSKFLEANIPKVRGALLVAVAGAMEIYDSVYKELKGNLPRMADFTVWGEAISRRLGYKPNEFYNAYTEKINESNIDVLSGNTVSNLLIEFMSELEIWTGTSTDLFDGMSPLAIQRGFRFPKSPSHLTREINDLRATLENAGIKVEELNDGNRTKRISKNKVGKIPSIASVPSEAAKILNYGPDDIKIRTIDGIVSPIIDTDGNALSSKLPSGKNTSIMAEFDDTDGIYGNINKKEEVKNNATTEKNDSKSNIETGSFAEETEIGGVISKAQTNSQTIDEEEIAARSEDKGLSDLNTVESSANIFFNTKGSYCRVLENCSVYRKDKSKNLSKGSVVFLYHREMVNLIPKGLARLACTQSEVWDPVSKECILENPLMPGVSSAVGSNVQMDGRSRSAGGGQE
ncbi:MAG: hypothetical protein M1161_00565 [Candidatus Thermoplasmatota archaeon]|nr:hypothetical protein [Candidatus Thermoplasmatota archaeon]